MRLWYHCKTPKLTAQITLALRQILRPVAQAQIRQAKALGLSHRRIYAYYFHTFSAIANAWSCKGRHASWFWHSQVVISIIAHLIDLYDTEVIEEDGEMKPAALVKALAIALKEL